MTKETLDSLFITNGSSTMLERDLMENKIFENYHDSTISFCHYQISTANAVPLQRRIKEFFGLSF